MPTRLTGVTRVGMADAENVDVTVPVEAKGGRGDNQNRNHHVETKRETHAARAEANGSTSRRWIQTPLLEGFVALPFRAGSRERTPKDGPSNPSNAATILTPPHQTFEVGKGERRGHC